jgi:hypothetical protein
MSSLITMDKIAKAIVIPIFYSTNTTARQGYIELFFANEPEIIDKTLPATLKNASHKSDLKYRKHNIYGNHQYLIPVRHNNNWASSIMSTLQIGDNPTTVAHLEKLQLMPCNQSNLSLICQLQSQPFFIEITKQSYFLHVLMQGIYCKIPAQKAIPKNWERFPYPVISLVTDSDPVHFSRFTDIPWSDIAATMGSPAQPMQIIESPCFNF